MDEHIDKILKRLEPSAKKAMDEVRKIWDSPDLMQRVKEEAEDDYGPAHNVFNSFFFKRKQQNLISEAFGCHPHRHAFEWAVSLIPEDEFKDEPRLGENLSTSNEEKAEEAQLIVLLMEELWEGHSDECKLECEQISFYPKCDKAANSWIKILAKISNSKYYKNVDLHTLNTLDLLEEYLGSQYPSEWDSL
jgi:hypothetical protein